MRRHGLVVETEPFDVVDRDYRVDRDVLIDAASYVGAPSSAAAIDPGPQRYFDHDPHDLLSVAGLAATYGRRIVVEDVHLRVRSGEVVVLLGHNGSGKSA